jgi:hypothetical protein
MLGFTSSLTTNIHFNGGVIFCKDIPNVHDFFAEWHRLWLFSRSKSILFDQPSFNQVNILFDRVIKEINGIWNCQILSDGAIRYLPDSKIIHYCASTMGKRKSDRAFLLGNPYIFQKIKDEELMSEEIKQIIQEPRLLFSTHTRLIVPDKCIDSASFYIFRKLYNFNVFFILELVLLMFKYIRRCILNIK